MSEQTGMPAPIPGSEETGVPPALAAWRRFAAEQGAELRDFTPYGLFHAGWHAAAEDQDRQDDPRCLISPAGCPTPRERDLLAHARAMDYALTHVRLLAHASRDGLVPGSMLLKVLSRPYRFPLPGDAAALAAYRAVFGEGNLAIGHLADCGRCNPVGYDRDFCPGYDAAARADYEESLRERGRG